VGTGGAEIGETGSTGAKEKEKERNKTTHHSTLTRWTEARERLVEKDWPLRE